MWCHDTGSMEAIRIPKETIKLAQQIQRMTDIIVDENDKGNGEIVIKIKVMGGKICRFLNFAGNWFPGNKDTKKSR